MSSSKYSIFSDLYDRLREGEGNRLVMSTETSLYGIFDWKVQPGLLTFMTVFLQLGNSKARAGGFLVCVSSLGQFGLEWRVFRSNSTQAIRYISLTSRCHELKPKVTHCLFFVLFRFIGTQRCRTIPNWLKVQTDKEHWDPRLKTERKKLVVGHIQYRDLDFGRCAFSLNTEEPNKFVSQPKASNVPILVGGSFD